MMVEKKRKPKIIILKFFFFWGVWQGVGLGPHVLPVRAHLSGPNRRRFISIGRKNSVPTGQKKKRGRKKEEEEGDTGCI